MATSLPVIDLPVVNLSDARFECIFGRGCDGICCRNGRPPVYPDEQELLDENLHKFLPHLRPEARRVLEKSGYLSNRLKGGVPMLRVVDGWCVFFNAGCILHKVGAAEGDKYQYKPAPCALFPLARNDKDEWYIRQKGVEGEEWDLFCLGPPSDAPPAAETLREEMELAARYAAERLSDEASCSPGEPAA
jgi:Fe-S-cluster containining protein